MSLVLRQLADSNDSDSTNSRASDLAAAANVFRDAAKANNGEPVKVAKEVEFYLAAASIREQETAEASGDWQVLLAAGGRPLPSGCGMSYFKTPVISQLGTANTDPDRAVYW